MSDIFASSYTKLYNKVKELNTPAEYIIYKLENDEEYYFS
jgi:hypothetical protein